MKTLDELIEIIAELDDKEEIKKFFSEIFTTSELDDLSLRWQLLKELYAGKPQRAIATAHKISLCKITRGSKILKAEHSVTFQLLKKYYQQENQ